jgi:hypothetical protein
MACRAVVEDAAFQWVDPPAGAATMAGMSADADYLSLLAVLTTIAQDGDTDAAIERILDLLPSVGGPAWVRELAYVARHYS